MHIGFASYTSVFLSASIALLHFPAAAAGDIAFDKLKRAKTRAPVADPFARPAPPPSAVKKPPRAQPALPVAKPDSVPAAAPPPPSAPALPFKYVGKLVDGDKVTLFLAKGDTLLSVKPGEVFEKVYVLERVTDTQASILYQPLKQTQQLSISKASN
jgi:hypothetical protein